MPAPSNLINFDQAFVALLGRKCADDMVERLLNPVGEWVSDDDLVDEYVLNPSLRTGARMQEFMDSCRAQATEREQKDGVLITVIFSNVNLSEGGVSVTMHIQPVDRRHLT